MSTNVTVGLRDIVCTWDLPRLVTLLFLLFPISVRKYAETDSRTRSATAFVYILDLHSVAIYCGGDRDCAEGQERTAACRRVSRTAAQVWLRNPVIMWQLSDIYDRR